MVTTGAGQEKIRRLPDLTGMKSEVPIQKRRDGRTRCFLPFGTSAIREHKSKIPRFWSCLAIPSVRSPAIAERWYTLGELLGMFQILEGPSSGGEKQCRSDSAHSCCC